MTANAPYYRIGTGNYQTSTQETTYGSPEVEEFTLSSSIAAAPTLHSESTPPQSTVNNQIADLLEAAAAGRTDAGSPREANHGVGARRTSTSQRTGQGQQTTVLSRGKRKRGRSPSPDGTVGNNGHGNKRTKVASDIPTDPDLLETDTRQAISGVNSVQYVDDGSSGVHSATALFRKTQQGSKKYTRPPMSKLFTSLKLTPENFLQLQAQAKSYMLDSAHPERQNCVGSRGKGDTDMVKLRLFNCVRDFLAGGAGEQFFGENVEAPGDRETMDAARALGQEAVVEGKKWVWPGDGNQIIGLVTPLLRRMVTNERQRMYAIVTRKGGLRRKEGSADLRQMHEEGGLEAECNLPQLQAHIEPSLAQDFISTERPNQTSPVPSSVQPVSSSVQLPPHSYEQQTSAMIAPEQPVIRSETPLDELSGRPLPEREFILHTIDVVLWKNNARLEQRAKIESPTIKLNELHSRIEMLLKMAVTMYPALRAPAPPKGLRPDLLRGFAVAAAGLEASDRANLTAESEILDDSAVPTRESDSVSVKGLYEAPDEAERVPPPRELPPNLSGAPFEKLGEPQLPGYKVKAMVTQGLKDIQYEEEWDNAKRDVGSAVWADGVIKVVVDLDV